MEITGVTVTTASLDLPITRAEERGTSLVAGLHTSEPGVRSDGPDQDESGKMIEKGKRERTKTRVEK
jgi:hypothetical protein